MGRRASQPGDPHAGRSPPVSLAQGQRQLEMTPGDLRHLSALTSSRGRLTPHNFIRTHPKLHLPLLV